MPDNEEEAVEKWFRTSDPQLFSGNNEVTIEMLKAMGWEASDGRVMFARGDHSVLLILVEGKVISLRTD